MVRPNLAGRQLEVIELRPPVFSEPPNSGLAADIYESRDGRYVIEIPVPGLKPDELEVKIDPYSITVSSRPKQPRPAGKYFLRELSLRPLTRTFNFPFALDKQKIRITLERGILLIQVPKPVSGKRKVPVQSAA